MSYTHHLTPYQWDYIYAYLSEYTEIYVRNEEQCRQCVEGVFWLIRSGSQWRFLPREYGNWNTLASQPALRCSVAMDKMKSQQNLR